MNEIKYITVSSSELSMIDYSQVRQTSSDTVRKSIDGTLGLISFHTGWCGCLPPSIESLTTRSALMDESQLQEMLSGPDWSRPPIITE